MARTTGKPDGASPPTARESEGPAAEGKFDIKSHVAMTLIEAMEKVYGAKRLVDELKGPTAAGPKAGQP